MDGTGRLQTVSKATNPRYYRLIQRFGEATGVPLVLNTSFNLKGEPIVNTPEEAFSTFSRSGMDALACWITALSEKNISYLPRRAQRSAKRIYLGGLCVLCGRLSDSSIEVMNRIPAIRFSLRFVGWGRTAGGGYSRSRPCQERSSTDDPSWNREVEAFVGLVELRRRWRPGRDALVASDNREGIFESLASRKADLWTNVGNDRA